MFMALAFSRSMVTSTWGSLAEKVVSRPLRSLRARLAPTIWCATRSRSVMVFLPWSWSSNWKPPKLPTPCTAGGWNNGHETTVGREHEHLQLGRKAGDDVGRGVALAAPLVGGLGGDKHQAGIGSASAEAEAHHRECANDIRVLTDDGRGAVGERAGVSQRRAGRRLDDDDEIALIFLGNEAGGYVQIHPHRSGKPGEEQHQQHVANAKGDVNRSRIGTAHPADGGVGAMNERGEGAGNGPDVQEVQLPWALFFAAEEQRRQRRRQGERVEGGDRDGERDGQRKLPVEDAGGAREERYRNEHGDQHQRGGDDSAGDLAHGLGGSFVRVAVFRGNMPLHVFDDHDGVIDHEAGGQRNAEQGERVDGEAEDLDETRRCRSATPGW